MAKILFNHVYKRYGKFKEYAVNDFNLEVEDREFLVFVGSSGCGKSTTLRMLAGLEEISEGEIYIGDTKVNDVPPKDRDISMVFQNYALYPNMSVFENIAFGLRLRKMPKHEIELSVKRAARVLEIENFLDRKPKELSGGQRQRVALGRAIVRTPQAFLMDEPLSNLDAKLRVQMRTELINLHKKIGVTIIYVTHDQVEAMTMGDRIVVMEKGVIQQVDTPENVYNKPANLFVANFIGNPPMNVIAGRLQEGENGLEFHTNRFALRIPQRQAHQLRSVNQGAGRSVVMGIRPENISFEDAAFTAPDHEKLSGVLQINEFVGSDRYYHMNIGTPKPIVVRAHPRYHFGEGERAEFAVDMNKALFFHKETEKLLAD
ncbi:ABC transporter ATP-binding protein [Paenibacillus cisolokensis]|uniref:Sugar ABC transporter ATP-binding protein n=1 Tax=Paenibacillus cisolokensis TaxID=1658519 RepID=A0ABQ4NB39_9BACL|nr:MULTISPECIES: ABC transporter ATP-binding protein [Paenibacillus]ALS29064.1 sugar ABC transporter ATP-binding protein [Paenibacillus sp. 32O-W]GIQ65397.1 sugar ABC transporter ATP-binding protein [Paenibacillus cisolokensis]